MHAAGAGRANAVLICVDKGEVAVQIATLLRHEYPLLQVLARSFDRGFSLQLLNAGVDFQVRETFESALVFGENTLKALGVDEAEAAEVIEDVRRRDQARFDEQLAGIDAVVAAGKLLKGNMPVPTPLAPPRRAGRALNEETAAVLEDSPNAAQ